MGGEQSKNMLVHMLVLGMSLERCQVLAARAGLKAVCDYSGVRHACERRRFTEVTVHQEETMHRVIQSVRSITGL